jgi:hypothetical protein
MELKKSHLHHIVKENLQSLLKHPESGNDPSAGLSRVHQRHLCIQGKRPMDLLPFVHMSAGLD